MKKLLLLFIAVTFLILAGCSRQPAEYDDFAACLTEKGARMYGTEWCPYCKEQKSSFAGSFDLVNYTDCGNNLVACQTAGVEGYPTWIFADGTKLSGKQSLRVLADKTDCELISTNNE